MVRISENGPGWNKAERLSSVNHTTKTIHHHQHHHQLKPQSDPSKKRDAIELCSKIELGGQIL